MRDLNLTVTQLFHSELHINSVKITKCIHLGKVIQNKVRPVFITVLDSTKRSSILHNTNFLCKSKSENHKNILISPDMTLKERELAKELRAKLKR